MKLILDLFIAFAKVGVMTFGGGYAMIPILQREIIDNHHWAKEEEMMDYYAVAQCTPGIIAVNTATFIGHKVAGDIGGIVATLGVVFPSLIIISLLAGLINTFSDLAIVQHAFAGIRVCVIVLILNSVLKLGKAAIKDLPALIIFVLTLALSFFFNISPVILVVVCAAAGIILTKAGVHKK